MLPNKAIFTKKDLINIFGESALKNINDSFASNSVSSDSRNLKGRRAFCGDNRRKFRRAQHCGSRFRKSLSRACMR